MLTPLKSDFHVEVRLRYALWKSDFSILGGHSILEK